MAAPEDESVTVTYTVKELLTEIRADVKDMRLELGKKADASELLALQIQFNVFERSMVQVREQAAIVPSLRQEIDHLKTKITTEGAVDNYRRWIQRGAWGVALTLLITAINLITRVFKIGP